VNGKQNEPPFSVDAEMPSHGRFFMIFYVGLKKSAQGRKWDEKIDRVRVRWVMQKKIWQKENAKNALNRREIHPRTGTAMRCKN
jgi:hypothetical protein